MTSVNEFRGILGDLAVDLSTDDRELMGDADEKLDMLSRLAKVLESSHQIATRTLSELVVEEFPDVANVLAENVSNIDDDADQYYEPELGFFLFWLREDNEYVSSTLEDRPNLRLAYRLLDSALPPHLMTMNHFSTLFGTTPTVPQRNVWISKDGTVYGTAQYEQLDKGWVYAVVNLVKTLWDGTIVKPFPTRKTFSPVRLQANDEGSVKIAVIGDWGGGNNLAKGVMQTVKDLNPDYIIHLGDVYYAGTDQNGTPPNEEKAFLVDFWKQHGMSKEGRCFTLNSNHEMYSGARGYFKEALPYPMFKAQEEYSYFALEFGDWIIAGFDSAYYANSLLMYMDGSLGGQNDPQYDFLREVAATGKKSILMTHHNPITYQGTKSGLLWGQSSYWNKVNEVITPNYWYWGHIHLGAVYNNTSAAAPTKARCLGNSCIPIGTPRGLVGSTIADWYADTPMNAPNERVYPNGATRVKNGFAIITLTKKGITEEFYNAGSTKPIHTI